MDKTRKTIAILKDVGVTLTAFVALYQILFTNDQRAKENFENAAKIVELSQQVEAQQVVMEAALKCDFE